MSLGLQLWLAKRSKDRFVRLHAASDIRRRIRQQWLEHNRHVGKGNGSKRRERRLWLANRWQYITWPEMI